VSDKSTTCLRLKLSVTCSERVGDLVGDTFEAGLKRVSDKIDVMEWGLYIDMNASSVDVLCAVAYVI